MDQSLPFVKVIQVHPHPVWNNTGLSPISEGSEPGASRTFSLSEDDQKTSSSVSRATSGAYSHSSSYSLSFCESEDDQKTICGGRRATYGAYSSSFCEFEDDTPDLRSNSRSTGSVKMENARDCYLSDVSSLSGLEERRSIDLLMDEPADDCCLGTASDLCESDGEDTRHIDQQNLNQYSGPIMLEERRSISLLMDKPADDCCLGTASDLSEEYDAPSRPIRPVMQCWGDTLESECSTPSELDPGFRFQSDREDKQHIDQQYMNQYSGPIMLEERRSIGLLMDKPADDCCLGTASDLSEEYDAPSRPVRPVMQCWGDTLESECSTPSELDPVIRFNQLLDFRDDSMDMGYIPFYRTSEDMDDIFLEMDTPVLSTVAWPSLERNTPVLVYQQTGSGDTSWRESVALGEQACLGSAAGSSARLPEALLEAGGRAVAQTKLKRRMRDVPDVHLEMQRHLDAVEHTLTFDPQQQESLRREEQRAENLPQPKRKEAWFKRLGNALKGLGKRKKKRKEECEGGEGGPGCDELCLKAQDVSISQATMAKMREAAACNRNWQTFARDQRGMDLLQETLEDMERSFQKQNVQSVLDSHQTSTCEGAEALKEEKRRKEEMLKGRKPKKMSLKRRCFACLSCFI